MARTSSDLPRMQNQSRARAPLDRGLNLVGQAVDNAVKSDQAVEAADDAAVRPDRAGQALQSERQRGAAQPRLCLRHEGARRAEARLRRPVFLASARSGGDPDRPEARRRHHRRRAAARHHRGHRRDPRRDRPDVRPRHRHAGRGPDQAEEARPRHQGGQAGREPAQAAAGDRRRRARAAGQARRPAAQHAHAVAHAGREAQAHRRGDHRHLCAARRPHGHARDARGARGSGVPRAQSRGLPGGQRAPRRAGGRATRG